MTNLRIVALALVLLPSIAFAKAPAAGAPIWSGRSGGYSIQWTTAEMTAGTLSAKKTMAPEVKKEKGCEREASWSLISAVGPILSVEAAVSGYCEGAAHPYAATNYTTYNLAKGNKMVSLTDLFPAAEIHTALLNDKIAQHVIKYSKQKAPATLDALMKLLANTPAECDYQFSSNQLQRFAFHHLEKGKVAVTLGLPYGCEASRGMLTQVRLLLKPSAGLLKDLKAAEARSAGFLQKDLKVISKGKVTAF